MSSVPFYSADIWSFGKYWRDSFTGLDYANQRYYSNVQGRFMSPDPYRAKAKGANNPAAPQSWNRYAYAMDDPVNHIDPRGLAEQDPESCDGGDDDDDCLDGGGGGGGDPTPGCDDSGCDGNGGDTAPGQYLDILPNVPLGNSYTQNQMQALTDGLNDAAQRLTFGSANCAGALSGVGADSANVANAVLTLDDTLYRILPLAAGTGAQTNDAENVVISSTGAFFTAAPNGNGTVTVLMPNTQGVKTAFTFASVSDLQGFMMLHELGHQLGAFGDDDNDTINGENSAAVLQNCFTQGANGVWQ